LKIAKTAAIISKSDEIFNIFTPSLQHPVIFTFVQILQSHVATVPFLIAEMDIFISRKNQGGADILTGEI
jgi:hypothetical protein